MNFRVIAKKIFSLSLVFNALLTIACATGILAGFHWLYHDWHPFAPYLVSGLIFWFAIAAAAINLFPSAALGRSLHTGRFLFHHYFYGFMVLVFSAIYIVFFTHESLLMLFFNYNTSIQVNIGRFFVLGGLTLLLDDLPDASKKVESALNWLKIRVGQGWKIVSAVQLVTGAVSFYLFVAVTIAMIEDQKAWLSVANFILIGTVFITSVTSFIFIKRRVWLKIYVKH